MAVLVTATSIAVFGSVGSDYAHGAGRSGAALTVSDAPQRVREAALSRVVDAGRHSWQLGRLRRRSGTGTLADAVKVFGRPSKCRAHRSTAVARWRLLGIKLDLATLGTLPPGQSGCTAPQAIYVSQVSASGTRWVTRRGLRVGDAVERVGELYPLAVATRPKGSFAIIHFLERCVIGVCTDEYIDVPKLVAVIRAGRVVRFVLPVGAQGE